MAKQKYINCDIYKRGVTVFIGNYDELVKWSKEEFTDPEYKDFLRSMEDCSPGLADCHHDNGSCVVRIPKFPETPTEIAMLIHELLHATFYILDYSGVSYIAGYINEAYTYLLEYLTERSLNTDGYEEVPECGGQSDTLPNRTEEVISS